MGVQISVQESAFSFFGYILRSGLAGSYDNSVFRFLRGVYTILSSEALYFKKAGTQVHK